MDQNTRTKFAINLNPPTSTSPISSLACDPEGRMLAVGGRDSSLIFYIKCLKNISPKSC